MNSRVSIYWPEEDEHFCGIIRDYREDDTGCEYYVHYEDGDRQWEDLSNMKWKLLAQPTPTNLENRAHTNRQTRVTWTNV